jgi:hypothetical protein
MCKELPLKKCFLPFYWRQDTLYSHLSTRCHSIESEVKHFDLLNGASVHIFSWNDVPGKLLSHLQQVFKLESIDRYDIKKKTLVNILPLLSTSLLLPPL